MTKVPTKITYSALSKSRPVQDPDLLNIADRNYADTILKYGGLATKFPQLETDAKQIVPAINELKAGGGSGEIPPAGYVGQVDKLGGIFVGDGLNVTSDGVLSAEATPLEPATSDTLGGIKVGDYLNITNDGTLSVDSSAVGKTYYSGILTTIDSQNKINVNMTKSTPSTIAEQSAANPNVLFFTEGSTDSGTTIYTETITLSVQDWDSSTLLQTIAVSGITSTSAVIVSPVSDTTTNFDTYCSSGVRAMSQSTNSLTFKCNSIPAIDLTANIAYWET